MDRYKSPEIRSVGWLRLRRKAEIVEKVRLQTRKIKTQLENFISISQKFVSSEKKVKIKNPQKIQKIPDDRKKT